MTGLASYYNSTLQGILSIFSHINISKYLSLPESRILDPAK